MKTALKQEKTLGVQRFARSLVMFFGTALALIVTMGLAFPITGAFADKITLTVRNTGYYAQLTSTAAGTSGTGLNFNPVPGAGADQKNDTLTAKTNAKSGYKVYLSTPGNDNNLNLKNAPSGLSDDQKKIKPVTGTVIGDNTWGFSMNSGTTWAAVPKKGEEVVIKSESLPNAASGTGTQFNVTYGVKVNNQIAAGTYEGKVLYTMVADSTTSVLTGSVSPTTLPLSGGQIKVTVPLYANYNLTNDQVQITVGGSPCTDINIVKQDKDWMDVNCTAPAKDADTHDVKVNIPKAAQEQMSAGTIRYQ